MWGTCGETRKAGKVVGGVCGREWRGRCGLSPAISLSFPPQDLRDCVKLSRVRDHFICESRPLPQSSSPHPSPPTPSTLTPSTFIPHPLSLSGVHGSTPTGGVGWRGHSSADGKMPANAVRAEGPHTLQLVPLSVCLSVCDVQFDYVLSCNRT